MHLIDIFPDPNKLVLLIGFILVPEVSVGCAFNAVTAAAADVTPVPPTDTGNTSLYNFDESVAGIRFPG
jgi:hypothetical protein